MVAFALVLAPSLARAEFRAIGARWVLETDADGSMLGLYDVTYPTLTARIALAKLGHQGIAALAQAESDLQGVARSTQPGSVEAQEANDALAAIARLRAHAPAAARSELPAGWWRGLKWRNPLRARSDEEPRSFRLGDLDLRAMLPSDSETRAQLAKLDSELATASDRLFDGASFLASMHFERTEQGLSVSFAPTMANAPFRAKKMVDFRHPKDGLAREAAWAISEKVLDQLVGKIPHPVVQALVTTAANRFFHYRSLLAETHREMLIEFVAAAQEGASAYSPIQAFSEKERLDTAVSLTLTSMAPLSPLTWFLPKAEQKWRKDFMAELTASDASAQWLRTNARPPTFLNVRFAQALTAGGAPGIYSLGTGAKKKRGPALAIDYGRPTRIQGTRIAIESGMIAVDFGSRFIPLPLVGSILRSAYTRFVAKPVQVRQVWESRLTAHLEERVRCGSETWAKELALLDGQRVNPMELSRKSAGALVELFRQQTGLGAASCN